MILITELWADEEINGRIFLQAQQLNVDVIIPDKIQKHAFYEHMYSVQNKLSATKYHLDNFNSIYTRQFEELKERLKNNPEKNREATVTREAFELMFEIEAFLFQLKSSLDMCAKYFAAVAPGRIKTNTYGDAGDKLIRGLERLKNDKSLCTAD